MNIVSIDKSDFYNKYKLFNEGGDESILFRYSEDELLICYKKPNKTQYNNVNKLINLSDTIKKTSLPIKMVYINDMFFGYITKLHKDSVKFRVVEKVPNIDFKVNMLSRLKDNLKELTDNFIYMHDLDSENILINRKNKDVNIIDVPSSDTSIKNSCSKVDLAEILRLYKAILIESIVDKYDKEEYNFNIGNTLEKYCIDKKYIDVFVNGNLSYEFFDEYLKYMQKDKLLIKKRP